MMAAQIAVRRGHDVVLFEQNESLGGTLNDINKLPFKYDLLNYTEWVVGQTLACGADIRLGVEATPEVVMRENPDAIIVATGAEPIQASIPGIDRENVVPVRDVDSGRVKVSGEVVVCGGGSSGCETALALAMDGCKVTIVEKGANDSFAHGMTHITRGMLIALLESNKVTCLGEHVVLSVDDEGVHVGDSQWQEQVLKADFVVDALGLKPTPSEQYVELIPEVHVIGDCGRIGNIYRANQSAFDCAMEL